MVALRLFVAVMLSLAAGKKMPPGIWGPWKSPEKAMFGEVPFPHVHEDDMKPVNFSSCGGTIYNPTVISTPMYPFGNVLQACTWFIKTRPCFLPRLTLVSATPAADVTKTVMNVLFNETTKVYTFTKSAPGTVFQATRNSAEIRYNCMLTEQKGYGFQMLVDFIPASTPECTAGFSFLPDSTCVPKNIQGDHKYVLSTPGYPTRKPPPNFACKHAASISDGKFQNVDIILTSALKGTERLEVKDLHKTTVITKDTPSLTIKTSKPFFIMYAADNVSASSGFTSQVQPSAVQAPAPCNTVITVDVNGTTIRNPIVQDTQGLLCVIQFKVPSGKLNFNFKGFSLSSGEFAKLYKDYLGLGGTEWQWNLPGPESIDTEQNGYFVYKAGNPPKAWSFVVKQVV